MSINLNKFSDSELFARIDDLQKAGGANFVEQCEVLYELYKRGTKHPLHKPKGSHVKVYSHFENVALGRLSPALVMYFGGHPGKIAKFVSYGPEIQKMIAADRPFTVAMVDENGAIVRSEKIVRKMKALELDFAFPGNGYLATFGEQSEKLSAIRATRREAVEPQEIIQVHSEKSIKVRGNVVTVDELAKVLKELGYSVVKE